MAFLACEGCFLTFGRLGRAQSISVRCTHHCTDIQMCGCVIAVITSGLYLATGAVSVVLLMLDYTFKALDDSIETKFKVNALVNMSLTAG